MRPTILLVPVLLAALAPAWLPAREAKKPAWIMTMPELPGRVYGMGVASVANTKALALRQAQDGAKADVLTRLRANIKSDTQVKTDFREDRTVGGKVQTATASRSTNAITNVSVQAKAMDLPGLKVETTYLEEDGAGPTLYALAYLDVAIASQEVQARLDAITIPLAGDRGDDLRAKVRRAHALKVALGDLGRLEDLFGLIRAGGADPSLGDAILKARLKVERERSDLRNSLTFGMEPDPEVQLDAEILNAVRNAFLQEGLGWTDLGPDLAITMRVRGARNDVQAGGVWWDSTRNADFILAQGAISMTLIDKAGQQYESAMVVAKGVGANEFQAETLLLQDYKAKVARAVIAWIADLGK
jgi:hypothetical protein